MSDAANGEHVPGVLQLSALSRESPVTEIARVLLGQLLNGHIAPGTRLPSERQLAQTLDVGRSAIREALKALDVLGLIEVRQGDGTYLKGDSSDLLPQAIEWGLMLGQPRTQDLVEARRHLEVVITRLAAERIDADGLAALERNLATMREAPTTAEFVEADIAFHMTLARAGGNSVLNDVLHSVRALLRVWIRRAIAEAGSVDRTCAEHRRVLDALAAHDPDAAAAAMHDHMQAANTRLQASLAD